MRKNLLYIGNKLVNKGFSATTIDTLGPLLEAEGFKVWYASAYKNKVLRMGDMLGSVLWYGKRADYVLIDTYSTSNFWYACAVARLCRLMKSPYIPLLRGGNLPKRLKKSPKLSSSLFAKAYCNVAPSAFLLQKFRLAGFDNLEYIPNNVQISDYSYRKRNIIHPRLLWVRAFASIYNPMLALKALELLLKGYPEATLCMIGPDKDGSLSVCKDYAEQNGLPVEFTGKLSKKAWRERAVGFDIFLNTTYIDNMPISVIEAMALGLPVVSTAVGGIPYLLENKKDALLVDANNEVAFAEALCWLLENPERAFEQAAHARQKVEHFDWQKVKYLWLGLLN